MVGGGPFVGCTTDGLSEIPCGCRRKDGGKLDAVGAEQMRALEVVTHAHPGWAFPEERTLGVNSLEVPDGRGDALSLIRSPRALEVHALGIVLLDRH